MLASAPSTASGRDLEVGFADPLYADPAPSTRALWLDRTANASASIVRLGISWAAITGGERPADPRNPSDPAYRFGALDAAVRDATGRGLEVLLTVQGAPRWAEGPHRPSMSIAPPGSWKPSPTAYGEFAQAVAARYSGEFDPPGLEPLLPHVRYYQAWNEPNLDSYLTPQWKRRRPVGALRYRRLLNAFYAGIKVVDAQNVVVTAGTAPFGDRRGGQRMRPLVFWRSLLCLRPAKRRCARRAKFDVAAHHPITSRPRREARHPGDAVIPELRVLRRLIRKAERRRTIKPRGRHPLWVTEVWWETNPPDPTARISPRRQARWIAEGLYLISKQGVGKVILLQIRDMPLTSDPRSTVQTGVYFVEGVAKPSLTAVRFPFVTARRSARRLRAWGKAPAGGELSIQKRGKRGWRSLKRLNVGAGEIFTSKVRVRGPARLRAQVGDDTSLVWRQKD